MGQPPKFQVWKSSSRDHLNIVNTRPDSGARFTVVGQVRSADEAIEYAKALNRQEERLTAVNVK